MVNGALPNTKDLSALIDLTADVIMSFTGQVDKRWMRCHDLAHKVFFHSASINHLCKGTDLPSSASKGAGRFWDFPSIIVLTRTTIETYLKMFEVFFEPASEDECEYRFAVFELNGLIIRKTYPPLNPDAEVQKRVEDNSRYMDELKNRIKKTKHFSSLDRGQQNASLDGSIRPNRKPEKVAIAAGFDQKMFGRVYGYTSAYVHADSLSAIQIGISGYDEAQKYIVPNINMVMLVILKILWNYSAKFPSAKMIVDNSQTITELEKKLSKAAGK